MGRGQSLTARKVKGAAFIAALIASSLTACTQDQGIEGSPQDLTEVTADHAAMRVLADGADDYNAFSAAASERGLDFVCGAGGGPAPWELCLVADNDVLAIVPFDGIDGLVARLSDPGPSEDVVISLDIDQPVGVLHTGAGSSSVDIEYNGQAVGALSTP
jgi:hypothetical protein